MLTTSRLDPFDALLDVLRSGKPSRFAPRLVLIIKTFAHSRSREKTFVSSANAIGSSAYAFNNFHEASRCGTALVKVRACTSVASSGGASLRIRNPRC